MRLSTKPLRLFAGIGAALGLLSISLTGEIGPAWITISWAAWIFSWATDRYPGFLAKVKRLENVAVAGMVLMLLIDFLVIHLTVFIAVTHFLLLFQMVKLIGEKARKDCLQIFLFSFFQILAACTLSVDAWHAAVLLSLIPIATATLFWNQIDREWEKAGGSSDLATHRRYRGMATRISLVSIPVNLVLTIGVFVLFPRLKLNASLPGFSGHRSGYSDQMNLAQKGQLQQDSSVALWLSFPNAEERGRWSGYLKGDVLSDFDGRQWTASKQNGSRMLTPDPNGNYLLRAHHPGAPLLHQTITLANSGAATLFMAPNPLRIRAPLPALQESAEGSLHWLVSWNRPLRYDVVSEWPSDEKLLPVDRQLPNIPLERIRALAHQVAGAGSPLQQARNIESYLRKTYRYSTDYGDHVPDNPVDYFLFERRQGSCGHFASTMALMLRLQNIPSRLVAGYLKGEWNEPAQSVVIRERDAHAWVEAYMEGSGWVTFDPSPRQAEGGTSRRNWYREVMQYWDYLDLQWNRFVIQYDLYSQIKAFENLKGTSGQWGLALYSRWENLRMRFGHQRLQNESDSGSQSAAIPWKKMIIFFSLMFTSSWIFLYQRRNAGDPSFRFYNQFLDKMARAGHPKTSTETGREFAERLETRLPAQAMLAREVTERYYRLRFGRIGI